MTDNIKAGMFKYLVNHSFYDTGIHFELDKHYKSVPGLKNKVYKVYQEVQQDPERFLVQQETVDLVVNAVNDNACVFW